MSDSSESGESDDNFSNVTEEEDGEKSTDLIEEESSEETNVDFESESCLENVVGSNGKAIIKSRKKITSPYDPNTYSTIVLREMTHEVINELLINGAEYQDDVNESPPWHVLGDSAFLIDLNKLKSRQDLTVDAWHWNLSKCYIVSSDDLYGPFGKGNFEDKFRLAKRIYKNKSSPVTKCIYSRCLPNKKVTGQGQFLFRDDEQYALITYEFKTTEIVPPSDKPRVYASVRSDLKRKLESGEPPKKASYQVLKERGGIDGVASSSEIPNITQAYVISRTINKTCDDPFRKLIEKQQKEGFTESSVIQKIQTNQFSFDVVLFNQRMIDNIANYCCTNYQEMKSSLCWDFTFDLGKSPPYYALVLSYQNTTLLNSQTKKCPTLLGPILICHKKDEKSVKLLCDSLLDACPGLAEYLKVLGADGENRILNQTCKAFPNALLLLCLKHIEENIRRNFPKTISSLQKDNILRVIFGNLSTKGLVDCESFQEFDERVADFYNELSSDDFLKGFATYFQRIKEPIIKYHTTKAVVDACSLNTSSSRFYNNNVESINKLIKHWQQYKKLDLFSFVKEYEDLIGCQESDILKAFLNLKGPYEVRKEYEKEKRYFNEYSVLNLDEKNKLKKHFLNVEVEPDQYKIVTSYKPGRIAIQKIRDNIEKILSEKIPKNTENMMDNTLVRSSTEIEIDDSRNVELDGIVFLLSESLQCPSEEDIRASVLKSVKIVNEKNVVQGFNEGEYLVKSTSSENVPHLVRAIDTGLIKCDIKCKKYNNEGYCSHTISVAISQNTMQPYANALTRHQPQNLTKTVSQKIKTNLVGRKKPVRDRSKKNVSVLATHESDEQFNEKHFMGCLKYITTEFVITLLGLCDKRVTRCYGCSNNFKCGDIIPPQPFDLVIVAKMKRTYRKDGNKCLSEPQNVYFHLAYDHPLFETYECIRKKCLTFNEQTLLLDFRLVNSLHDQHKALLRDSNLSHFC